MSSPLHPRITRSPFLVWLFTQTQHSSAPETRGSDAFEHWEKWYEESGEGPEFKLTKTQFGAALLATVGRLRDGTGSWYFLVLNDETNP